MTQIEFIFSIEAKRDEAINLRRCIDKEILLNGDNDYYRRELNEVRGRIAAYDEILAELRAVVISETLKEWRNNA